MCWKKKDDKPKRVKVILTDNNFESKDQKRRRLHNVRQINLREQSEDLKNYRRKK